MNGPLSIDRQAVSERVALVKGESGLTVEQLAKRCEMTGDTVLRMLNAKTGFHTDTLFRFCTAMGISADWLLWGESRP